MIGTKVRLTKRCAKWFLDNPDVFFFRDIPNNGYDTEMQIFLYVCMGGKVYGKITKKGDDCWAAKFATPFGSVWHYFELHKDIEVL